MPDEYKAAAKVIAASMADQALWSKVLARLRGHVNTPGVYGYYRTEIRVGSGLEGVDGDVWLEGDGVGTGAISPEARAAMLRFLDGDESQRSFLLKLFGIKDADPAPGSKPPADSGAGEMLTPMGSK